MQRRATGDGGYKVFIPFGGSSSLIRGHSVPDCAVPSPRSSGTHAVHFIRPCAEQCLLVTVTVPLRSRGMFPLSQVLRLTSMLDVYFK